MSQEAPRAPYTVSELTGEIRSTLESRYEWLQVRGEISNYKKAPSGHVYFNLKDESAVLSCVAWRSVAARWGGLALGDGIDVVAGGSITLYPPRGQYQLKVEAIRLAGVGALQQRFEALKAQLAAEGLFDSERKRPLPAWPARIALITSPTGAAVRDFIRTLRQGGAPVHAVVLPVRVQGAEAPLEIADAIQTACESGRFDTIALVRGGGSLEDLWAFNEEIVARAIYEASIPVISGVGHEIDFSIADFVADLRAATPTAAAQAICDCFDRHRGRAVLARDRLLRSAADRLARERERLSSLTRAMRRCHPKALLFQERQRFDDRVERLRSALSGAVENRRAALAGLRRALAVGVRHELGGKRQTLDRLSGLLHSYDPHKMMGRGYAICRRPDGGVIQRVEAVKPDDLVDVEMADGSFRSHVTEVSEKS